MKSIKCIDNDFWIDGCCDNCVYFDENIGDFGGCIKSGNEFVGFTNIAECEDLTYDIKKCL